MPNEPLTASSAKKTPMKHKRQARRRDRENADFRGTIFFILFLLKIAYLRRNRRGIRQRLPSFLTLFFCNVLGPKNERSSALYFADQAENERLGEPNTTVTTRGSFATRSLHTWETTLFAVRLITHKQKRAVPSPRSFDRPM